MLDHVCDFKTNISNPSIKHAKHAEFGTINKALFTLHYSIPHLNHKMSLAWFIVHY